MKLSVVVITYNHERFIAQALQSVLDQRVDFAYEVVIGEDCSTDRTREIVKDFHARYPDRVVPILRDTNVGMMRNFMDAMAACRGQYIAVLEGDDYWTSPDKLQRQVDFLEAHPDYAICCGRAQVLDEIDAGLPTLLPANAAGPHTIEDLFKENFIVTGTAVYRWGALDRLPRWFGEMAMGDWPLHVLIARSGKINLMDDALAAYRVHSGGTWSSRAQVSRLAETIRMLTALDEELGFKYTKTIRETVAQCILDLRLIGQQNGNRAEAAKYLFRCLRRDGYWLSDPGPSMKGLVWYTLLGAWHPMLARVKRAILR